jgi:hypothetical protein
LCYNFILQALEPDPDRTSEQLMDPDRGGTKTSGSQSGSPTLKSLFAEKYAEELESPYTLPQRRRQLLESSRLHQQLLQLAGGEAAHLLRRIPTVSAADVSGGKILQLILSWEE